MNDTLELIKRLPVGFIGGLGEVHLDSIKEILDITKPSIILEFGFNTGYSSAMWLTLTDAQVLAVDHGEDLENVIKAVDIIRAEYPSRFKLYFMSTHDEDLELILSHKYRSYDLVFVDGDHSYEGCYLDLQLAAYLKAKYILVDDMTDTYKVSKATRDFVKLYNYKIIKEYNVGFGLALLKRDDNE